MGVPGSKQKQLGVPDEDATSKRDAISYTYAFQPLNDNTASYILFHYTGT